jgi:hypothetical protein
MGCDRSLGPKDIINFVYCFMILFLIVYIYEYFLLLVPFSHKEGAIMFSF